MLRLLLPGYYTEQWSTKYMHFLEWHTREAVCKLLSNHVLVHDLFFSILSFNGKNDVFPCCVIIFEYIFCHELQLGIKQKYKQKCV